MFTYISNIMTTSVPLGVPLFMHSLICALSGYTETQLVIGTTHKYNFTIKYFRYIKAAIRNL